MRTLFGQLWKFIWPYRGRLFLGMFFGILFALSQGLLVTLIQLVVNLVFSGGKPVSVGEQLSKAPALLRPAADFLIRHVPHINSPSSTTGLLLVISSIPALMLFRAIFGYLNIYLMTWSAARAIADLRTALFEHLQNLSVAFFSRARTGDLISRITNDTHALYGIVGNSLASLVKDPVTIICLLSIMLARQTRLTLISIIVLPVCVVPIIIYARKVRKSA